MMLQNSDLFGDAKSKQREDPFRLLTDLAPTAISIIENQNHFLYVNQFWETHTGYSAAESQTLRPVDLVHPEMRQAAIQQIEKTLSEGSSTSGQELKLVNKAGEILWIEFSARLIHFNHKQAILLVATDITRRKDAERALNESRKKSQKNIENIKLLAETALHFVNNAFPGTIYQYLGECLKQLNPDAYFIVNSVNMQKGFTKTEAIIGVDQYFTKILSILGFDPIGETYEIDDSIYTLTTGTISKFEHGLHELSFGKLPKKVSRHIERILKFGNIYGIAFIFDNQIYANAAMIFPKGKDIQNRETVEAFVKQASIALKRCQAEQALRESEEKFRTLADMAPTAICIFENQHNYLYVNKFWQNLTGYSAAESKNLQPIDIVHPEMKKKVAEKIDKRLEGASIPSDSEVQLITRDGLSRWIYYHARLITFEGKKAILTAGTDITRRKEAEKRIQSLLKEKEILLREVHHRIKNNMNSIESLLRLHCRRVKNPATIAALQDASSRIRSIQVLYDKLYYSDNFSEISIKDYLSTLLNEVIRLFPNRGSVKIIKKIDDFIINARITFPLGIIINELLTNSMKHAFTQEQNNRITVTATCKNQRVTIILQDNGVGIPESIDLAKSSGFGLQLVTLLTDQIDGRIRLERAKGTKFIIEFNAR